MTKQASLEASGSGGPSSAGLASTVLLFLYLIVIVDTYYEQFVYITIYNTYIEHFCATHFRSMINAPHQVGTLKTNVIGLGNYINSINR